jgi:hypothetical protein
MNSPIELRYGLEEPSEVDPDGADHAAFMRELSKWRAELTR